MKLLTKEEAIRCLKERIIELRQQDKTLAQPLERLLKLATQQNTRYCF